MENFFHIVFYKICILKSFKLIATFQLSAASLNLRQSQNGVLGNGLTRQSLVSIILRRKGFKKVVEKGK